MRLGLLQVAEIAYTAQQEALTQVGGTAGAPWNTLTQAQRDVVTSAVRTQLDTTPVPASPLSATVGVDNASKALAVFTAVVDSMRV